MNLPVIVLGAGGHARVLINALHLQGFPIFGLTTPDFKDRPEMVDEVSVLGDDEVIFGYAPDQIQLVNGLGSIGDPTRRIQLFEQFHGRGYRFATVIHPAAVVAQTVELLEGVQIMAGAVIQPGVRIGKNSIINTRVAVDHDCRIGNHVHLAPGVTLSGQVEVGLGSHLGTGATVIQQIKIGSNCLIGAGAVVIADAPDQAVVVGVPGRVIKYRKDGEAHVR